MTTSEKPTRKMSHHDVPVGPIRQRASTPARLRQTWKKNLQSLTSRTSLDCRSERDGEGAKISRSRWLQEKSNSRHTYPCLVGGGSLCTTDSWTRSKVDSDAESALKRNEPIGRARRTLQTSHFGVGEEFGKSALPLTVKKLTDHRPG